MTSIVFVTGHEFGCRALQGIAAADATCDGEVVVPLVIGLPQQHAPSTVGYESPGTIARYLDADFAEAEDGQLLTLRDRIEAVSPDYLFVVGWSRLIPESVTGLAIRRIGERPGAIGMHPTKLPEGRGRAPIPWTIIRNLDATALSVFVLRPEADSGPLIAQWPLALRATDTSRSLFWKMADLHFHAGFSIADSLATHSWLLTDQDEAMASVWEKRRPADGELTPNMTAAEVHRLVRAQQPPYPSAWVSMDGRRRQVRSSQGVEGGSGAWQPMRVADGLVWLEIGREE